MHDLLQAQFPEPLPTINQRLSELGEWQGELHHITKDGRMVAVASHWILHSRADDELHVIEVNNDISKLQTVQTELETLNSRLQRANAELASFAYEVAHDIEAPIRGVTALSELLSGKLRGVSLNKI
jgi:signal transduction histidine kinase